MWICDDVYWDQTRTGVNACTFARIGLTSDCLLCLLLVVAEALLPLTRQWRSVDLCCEAFKFCAATCAVGFDCEMVGGFGANRLGKATVSSNGIELGEAFVSIAVLVERESLPKLSAPREGRLFKYGGGQL